jgi:hypothetical protein
MIFPSGQSPLGNVMTIGLLSKRRFCQCGRQIAEGGLD